MEKSLGAFFRHDILATRHYRQLEAVRHGFKWRNTSNARTGVIKWVRQATRRPKG
jgi:hypothetical protein